MKPQLFSFVKIIDKKHKFYGRTGQLTDYDNFDKEYILHFDKITETGNIYWIAESTRVKLEQLEVVSKYELDKYEIELT